MYSFPIILILFSIPADAVQIAGVELQSQPEVGPTIPPKFSTNMHRIKK